MRCAQLFVCFLTLSFAFWLCMFNFLLDLFLQWCYAHYFIHFCCQSVHFYTFCFSGFLGVTTSSFLFVLIKIVQFILFRVCFLVMLWCTILFALFHIIIAVDCLSFRMIALFTSFWILMVLVLFVWMRTFIHMYICCLLNFWYKYVLVCLPTFSSHDPISIWPPQPSLSTSCFFQPDIHHKIYTCFRLLVV